MALRDLLTPVPQPRSACLPVSCGDCIHFSEVPFYTIEGKKTLCSHERVGRQEDDVPCPHFTLNTGVTRRITPAARDALATLLVEMGLGWEGKKNAQRRRDNREILDLIKLMYAVLEARRHGLELSHTYAFTTHSGEVREGRLIATSGRHAVVLVEGYSPWTVPVESLTSVT